MSPPPIEATRCQPSASATAVSAMITPIEGEIVNATVRPAKATSAPRFRTFLPGSDSGRDFIRPESFPKATIEPVKVTAPMNTPMPTSTEWMPTRSGATSVCPGPTASTSR